ncbi:hypothetical protein [Clostridium cibarium]|uniref:SH3 domain-containing protein n=1 Tax=Clostridium cibarium TaxID=2762247 RepID=A0ABR8PTL0_9CLOT|nr:hypothetical protein [Clostridium cibarium]MBD7911454.1 hypothetical protein [Clostridium cibarium]
MNKKLLSLVIAGVLAVTSLPAVATSAATTDTTTISSASRHYTRHPVPADYVGWVYCTGSGVRIRNGNGEIRGTLLCGQQIYIYGLINGQGCSYLHGERVYVAGQYLSTVPEDC